ncbi:unnamed protein product [Paramecium sonneborni]|uniref:Uncharacterized protein n=1 Tax=Paramecium sonneborni TaxID=65129 RepID=A0A8S1QBI5_9CILI|nr:unnamed protein product [Paramecium sonneborni]
MALNPPITQTGVPLKVDQEFFILHRNEMEGDFKIENRGKFKAKGRVFLTTCRIVFVNQNYQKDSFKSFDIPLAYLSAEKFEQPLFGNNYFEGIVDPLYNLLPGRTKFKLWFQAGGCDRFLKIVVGLLAHIRRYRNQGQRVPDARVLENFARKQCQIIIDPNDPSIIYVQQPTFNQQSYGNTSGGIPQNQIQVSPIGVPINGNQQQQQQQFQMNANYQQPLQGFQQFQQIPQQKIPQQQIPYQQIPQYQIQILQYQRPQQQIPQYQIPQQQMTLQQMSQQQKPQQQMPIYQTPQQIPQYQMPQQQIPQQQVPQQNIQNGLQIGIPINYNYGYQEQPRSNQNQCQTQQPFQCNTQIPNPQVQKSSEWDNQKLDQRINPQIQANELENQQSKESQDQPQKQVIQNQVSEISQNQNQLQPSQVQDPQKQSPTQNNDSTQQDELESDQVRNQPNTDYYFGLWGPQLQSKQNEIL